MEKTILSFHELTTEEMERLCPKPSPMEQGFYRMKFEREERPKPSAMEQGFYRMKFEREERPKPSAMEQGFYRMKFEREERSKPQTGTKPALLIKHGTVLSFGGHLWRVYKKNSDALFVIAENPVAELPFDQFHFGEVS